MLSEQTELPTLDSNKRPWVISAVVLGAIYLLTTVISLFFSRGPNVMPSTFATSALILTIVGSAISVVFLAGGILSLSGKKGGVALLTYAPVAAIAYILIQSYFNYGLFHSDAFTTFLTDKYAAAGVPQDKIDAMLPKVLDFQIGLMVVVGFIQLAYCVVLYLKMSSEPEVSSN